MGRWTVHHHSHRNANEPDYATDASCCRSWGAIYRRSDASSATIGAAFGLVCNAIAPRAWSGDCATMTDLNPDIIASVRLLSTDEGGRKSPIVASAFGCIFEHEGEANDCRLLLDGKGDVWPGQQLSVPIKFLCPELVRPRIRIGDSFLLREGKVIGRGTIEEVTFD
jgi:hypothetical protein